MKSIPCFILIILSGLSLHSQNIEEIVAAIKELPIEERLTRFKEGIENPDNPPLHRARYHHELGVVYFIQDDLFQAIEQTDKALEIRLQYEKEAGEEVIFSAYNLASFYHNLDDVDQAFAHFQLIVDRAPNSRMSYTLVRLGSLYRENGEFDLSERAFIEASKQEPFISDKLERANLLFEWADLYVKQDNPSAGKSAIPLLKEAFQTYDELAAEEDYYASDAVTSLNRLGMAYTYAQRFQEALQTFQRAHNYNKKCCQDENLTAVIYTNQGVAYRRTGNLDKALEYHRNTLDIRSGHAKAGKTNMNMARAYDNIASTLMHLDQFEEGLLHLQSALTWALPDFTPKLLVDNPEVSLLRASPYKNSLLTYLQDKGDLFQGFAIDQQQSHYYDAAIETYQLCDQLIDLIREDHVEQNTKLFWRDQARTMYQAAVRASWMADRPDMAFYFSEKSRAVLLLDGLRELNAHSRLPESTQSELSQLAAKIQYLGKSIYEASEEAGRPMEGQILILQEQYRHLLDSIEQDFPNYYRQKYEPEFVSLAQLQSRLQQNEAWVEYFLADQFCLALVIDNQSIKMVELAAPGELTPHINRLLDNLKNYQQPFDPQASLSLYQYLIAPLSLNTYSTLTFVPDGQLSLIPFETLVQQVPAAEAPYSEWDFLLNEFQIAYAFSANSQLFNPVKHQGNGRVFAFAPMGALDPEFGIDATLELPESRFTIEQIANILPTDIFLGSAANRQSFNEIGPKASVLHLATHAYLNHEQAEFSYFLLADRDKAQRQLYVNELYKHTYQADLAVLSACETGAGKLFRGEGVASIGRAFAQNGCPNLAISLWPVDERATGKLLESFYHQLKAGTPKAAALYQAKKNYLQETDNNQLNHPFRWAGFVYYGSDTPLLLGKVGWGIKQFSLLFLGLILVSFLLFRRSGSN